MEHENCESHPGPGLSLVVAKVALLAGVMGMGACARHLRHRHLEEGHDGGQRRHCRCGDLEDRHEGHGGHERARGDEGAGHRPATPGVGPLGILETRFANGDIDEDEFRRRRAVLRENTP